jgi:hypothetical protein
MQYFLLLVMRKLRKMRMRRRRRRSGMRTVERSGW